LSARLAETLPNLNAIPKGDVLVVHLDIPCEDAERTQELAAQWVYAVDTEEVSVTTVVR